jgi:hypothetical protein
MHRWSTALSLSASSVAIGLAWVALLPTEPGLGPAGFSSETGLREALHEVERHVAALDERVAALEARGDVARALAGERAVEGASAAATPAAGTPELREQIDVLAERLARLEDDETIARLAKTGEKRVIEDEVAAALERVLDPVAPPAARLDALRSLRKLGEKHASALKRALAESELTEESFLRPVLELTSNTALEADLRVDAIRCLAELKGVEAVRQPLLDLLTFDAVPEVRGEAAHSLLWHLDEPAVRDAILRASREDPHEGVRDRIATFLPKVVHIAREAAEAAERAAGGEVPGPAAKRRK